MNIPVKEFNVTQLNMEVICKQLLKNSIHNAVFILDTNGVIAGISRGVESIYGYSQEDLCGKYFDILFTKGACRRQKPELELSAVLQQGTVSDYNYILHKDGRKIWTEGESILITDVWGDSFIIKNVHALENQKKLQRELLEQNKKLRRLNNDLDTFVYTASHDLKNPVRNIESLVSIVESELQQGASPDSVEPVIAHIHSALDRFKATLNELTVISRIDAPTDEKEPYVRFDVLLEEVLYDLNDLIERSDAILYTDFDAAPGLHFSRKNLRSILFNLLSNALKYKSGDRRPEIRIESTEANGYVLLSVEDNGMGIEKSQHKKVFEFFRRIHTHVEGSGVGMGIVKKIMDNADGKITLKSTPDVGSVFTMHFRK
jgi:PAS domain S-box-containing protein